MKRSKDSCTVEVAIDRIKYDDGEDWRIVDLRPDGYDCVPLLGRCSFKSVREAMRRLKMRSAMIELLLAMIELPGLPPSPYGRENAKVKSPS